MRAAITSLPIILLLTCAASAQQVTVVEKAGGGIVTVRTDESGTTVNEEKTGVRNEPISPGDLAHWSKVYEFTKDGAKVLSHRSEAAK